MGADSIFIDRGQCYARDILNEDPVHWKGRELSQFAANILQHAAYEHQPGQRRGSIARSVRSACRRLRLVTMEDLYISDEGEGWRDVLGGFFDADGTIDLPAFCGPI
jgi:hypothetical protein